MYFKNNYLGSQPFSIILHSAKLSAMMKYPAALLKLVEMLKRLPGVGNRSAERFAFHLLTMDKEQLREMGELIQAIPSRLKQCLECGCLMGEDACQFCVPSRHVEASLCIVASARDVFAIEATGQFKGLYHVLGHLLSPLDGVGLDKLSLQQVRERVSQYQVKEVVIALDSTLEGDATALYIKQELEALPVTVTRLAFGLPMGSSLDYVDGGTLARALSGRAHF